MKINSKTYKLHRVVFWIYSDIVNLDDLPKEKSGLVIRHKCREKLCINGKHVEIGTRAENMEDKIRDGTHSRGENHGCSKITLITAQAIADSWRQINHPEFKTSTDRAKYFGVSLSCVTHIDGRRTWPQVKHPNGREFKGMKIKKSTTDLEMNDKDWKSIFDRLLSRTKKDPKPNQYCQTPCWRPLNPNLKGNMRLGYKSYTHDAYRWAAEYTSRRRATINDHARHLCGQNGANNACHNPDHLVLGTVEENVADRRVHGTSSKKLNIDKVNAIRAKLKEGDSPKDLADMFNVSSRCIYAIKLGQSWC